MKLKIQWHPQTLQQLQQAGCVYPWEKDKEFKIGEFPSDQLTIDDVMAGVEDVFAEWVVKHAPDKDDLPELQVHLLANMNKPQVALPAAKKATDALADGDTVLVVGEVIPPRKKPEEKPESEKIPVTILTGFLGAGKTTLLNYILTEQKEKKIAVIENEFGEVPIDQELLAKKLDKAEKVVVMDNGCMCCQVRGDLIEGLQNILGSIQESKI